MNDKPNFGTILIAAFTFLTIVTLAIASIISFFRTAFFSEHYLFEGLVLGGLAYVSVLTCVSIINGSDIQKDQERIKKGIVNIKEGQNQVLENQKIFGQALIEMRDMLIRMNMTRSGMGGGLFDFLSKNRTNSTADVSYTMVYDDDKKSSDISELNLDELQEMLNTALADEDYDTAAQVRDELERRE